MTYVPLWCKSNYSFLEGASHPEELVGICSEMKLPGMAITDRDGVYGVVRAHMEAKSRGVPLIIGAEMTVQNGGTLVLLAQDRSGYAHLCRLITRGRLRNEKGVCSVSWQEICSHSHGLIGIYASRFGDTGDKVIGPVRDAFDNRLYAFIARHREHRDRAAETAVRLKAARFDIPLVAAVEVLFHTKSRSVLQDVLTCIREGTTVDKAGTLLRQNDEHDIKSGEEFRILFSDTPDEVRRTREVADRCSFSLDQIVYRYPSEDLPEGYSTFQWLEELTINGAKKRYGGQVPSEVAAQLEKELLLVGDLDYCGYFLTMWEIIEYCRENDILCQGRGSAANSAICYCLGITAVDPVRMDLLFERFISRERAEPPDIDLDIEHNRREEVIQHMYEKYGRDRAAMVANIVRYRGRSAVREVGKALGIPATALDRLARLVSYWSSEVRESILEAGLDRDVHRMTLMADIAEEIIDFPRHLSIHPGGFILGSEPVSSLVPVENATMPGRTVIQWDKTDVEDMGLFKVDLLGLGALTQLHYAFDLLKEHLDRDITMAAIPHDDPKLFSMLSKSDTVGVFQLESRAQMSMLPRLKPRNYYDIVIEISIVRPGPISGGMVHPYLRRRAGEEEVTYPHSCLETVLKKTLGIPLFQEQVMKLAVLAADYTPGEADQLRRDMAAWRKAGRMEKHREKLISRMIGKGIAPEFAEQVYKQIQGFGEYGFPESHAASFALIAYSTAWLKCYYPAVFSCALLNAWPMGFYSPATLVEDAKRHGITFLPVDVMRSAWECTLVPGPEKDSERVFAVRMGLRFVKGLGEEDYRRIVRGRSLGPAGLSDFVRVTKLSENSLTSLAQCGALACFGGNRRSSLWDVMGVRRRMQKDCNDGVSGSERLRDEEMSQEFAYLKDFEAVSWDHETSGHSTLGHPLEPFRDEIRALGLPDARELAGGKDGTVVSYAGLVICRQRPGTANGVMFMTLEDETGFVNLVVWERVFQSFRKLLLMSSFLGITGRLQSRDGVVNVVVDRCWNPPRLSSAASVKSRDFR